MGTPPRATPGARPAAGLARWRQGAHLRGVRRAVSPTMILAAALAILSAARLPLGWASGNALNHVSGAWLTLADDLARGLFYRPLHDPALGFGGTRFFPLAFALHAGLVRLGVPLLAAGHLISLCAFALLAWAIVVLVGRLGAGRAGGLLAITLALAGASAQLALGSERGDLLAVALEASGLALVAGPRGTPDAPIAPGAGEVAGAAALFALAFATRPTALTAPGVAVLALALAGRRRAALALAALVGAGAAAAALLIDALSGGRFLAFLAVFGAGGGTLGPLLRAPLRLGVLLVVEDPSGLVLAGAAAAVGWAGLAARLRAPGAPGEAPLRARALVPALWLAVALASVVAVLGSPGTGLNHLLELEVASAVTLGVAAGTGATPARARARRLVGVAAAAGIAAVAGLARGDLTRSRLADVRAVLAAAPRPLLSEDPLVPLVAGERPAILDPWILRLAAARDPAVARPLLAALRARRPAAVVLLRDLSAPGAAAWYRRSHLGPAVLDELSRSYRLDRCLGRYCLYVPRDEPDVGLAPRVVKE